MITLPDTGASIKISLAGAITTNPVEVTYTVIDQSDTVYKPFPGNARVSASGATIVISPPVSGYTRNVKYFQVFNADTVTATVTVQYVLTSGTSTLFKVALAAGETVVYTSDASWRVYNATGGMRIAPLPGTPPIGIGAGNTQGSGPTFAYSDHNHTIRESGGPQDLTMGAVPDLTSILRSGTTLIGKLRTSFRLAADQATTSTALADITGFTLASIPAGTYAVHLQGSWTGSVNTEALRLGINLGGTISAVGIWHFAMSTAAGVNENRIVTANNTASAMVTGATGSNFVSFVGTFTTTTAGSFALRLAAETGGANSATLQGGTIAHLMQL